MSSTIVFNGTSYSIPAEGDSSWGTDLSNYLIAIASGSLQKSGGSFTLTSEVDFGANYGLKASYVKSRATNPASAGIVRLGNAESIKWRNQANNADLDLTVNSSDVLQFNGSSVLMPGIGSIVNADISNSAAIAYSKLNLTGNIVNADISNSAAIAYSKLNLSTSIVNADISASAAIAYSKLNLSGSILNADINASAAIAYSKLNLSNSILNADISSSAAIALSKLAALTTGKALQSNASTGVIEASSVTNTELSRLSGIGSSAVGISDTQILTNKDIDGGTAANTRRLTLPKDTLTNLTSLTRKQGTLVFDTTSNKPYYDDGSNLRVIGSGSGSGGNLIDDGDAEAGTSNYVEGSYSAATRPSGTFTSSSGSGAFAITTSSSSPLSGNNSFVLTKSSGASRQGRAVERTINLDLENRAKVLEVRIKYIVNSGSFVAGSSSSDSSLIWYIGQYNGSTWTYTEPSSFKMLSSSTSISDVLIGNFQTNYDTTQVKLIAYVAESTNSAWAVKCEVAIQPCNYVYGTPISDWITFTPTGSWTTNTTYTGMWRRVGDSMEIQAKATLSGAPNAVQLYFNMPAGYSIDTSKTFSSFGAVGTSTFQDSGVASYMGGVQLLSQIYPYTSANPSSGILQTVPFTFGNNDAVTIDVRVPVLGWSSNVQQSDSYDSRVIAARAYLDGGTTVTSGAAFIFSSKSHDKTNSYDTSNGRFTAPTQGLYNVASLITYASSSWTAGNTNNLQLYKNGSFHSFLDANDATATGTYVFAVKGSAQLELNAGDYIQIVPQFTGARSSHATAGLNWVCFEKLSSSQAISATEVVSASYQSTAGQSFNSTESVANFGTVIHDTHGAVSNASSNFTFTAPVAGFYEANARQTGGSVQANADCYSTFFFNGTAVGRDMHYVQSTNSAVCVRAYGYGWLNAGQTIQLKTRAGSAVSMSTSNVENFITIKRVK